MIERAGSGVAFVCALSLVSAAFAADAPPPASVATVVPGTGVLPAAPQRSLVIRACAACHAPEVVVAKRRTAEEWDEIIAKMVDRGAVASEEEQQQILEYLAKFFAPVPGAADAGAAPRS